MADDTRLVSLLEEAIGFCEANDVFAVVRNQPPFATAIGLVVEQGRRFSVTRAIRRRIWTAMGGKHFSPADFLARKAEWPDWEPSTARRELMQRVADNWKDERWLHMKGIGPWTRAAHRIMCSSDKNVCLEGDSHIRNMMRGITTWPKLRRLMDGRLSDVTRFFWRLSASGKTHFLRCLRDPARPLHLSVAAHFF